MDMIEVDLPYAYIGTLSTVSVRFFSYSEIAFARTARLYSIITQMHCSGLFKLKEAWLNESSTRKKVTLVK